MFRQLFKHHQPADLTANLTFLQESSVVALPQTAPVVYALGIMSRAANYQRLLLRHFVSLTRHQQQLIAMINSPHDKEAREGCKIVLKLEKSVHRSLEASSEKVFTRWNQQQCNKFVAHHMGWLTQAQMRKTLIKTNGKGLQLTETSRYRPVTTLTPKIAQAYKTFAREGGLAVAIGVASSFNDVRNLFCADAYHKQWLFRSITQAARKFARAKHLQIAKRITVDEFQRVYPDESGYLEALASYYKTRSVQTIMHKLGERGDPGDFTMWLCFNGFLRSFSLRLEQTAEVKKQVAKNSITYMGKTYLPHPSNTMEKVALALSP